MDEWSVYVDSVSVGGGLWKRGPVFKELAVSLGETLTWRNPTCHSSSPRKQSGQNVTDILVVKCVVVIFPSYCEICVVASHLLLPSEVH